MESTEIRLEDFLHEIGFGEARMNIQNNKVVSIPRQKNQRPKKLQGVRVEISIDEPPTSKIMNRSYA